MPRQFSNPEAFFLLCRHVETAEYAIIFTESYVRRARKFFKTHPELISQYEKCLELLEANPFHPSLRLHALRGKLKGLYSITIRLSTRLSVE